MARGRIGRYRGRGKKNSVFDIDITSLLDILTILLVFLLQNYNSSGVVINIPKGIELPKSASQSLNSFGVNIQVSVNQIWVDDKEIINTDSMPTELYDQGGRRIIPLYDELVKVKEKIKGVEKSVEGAAKFSGLANLIIDKSLKYDYIKRIMYTCAEAGFKEYKFVVMANQ